MGRLFILICVIVLGILFINGIIGVIIDGRDANRPTHKKTKEKKEDRDWWYSVPHYWVMSNGEKINIAEYLTWEEYKNMTKERKAQFYAMLENRLLFPSRPELKTEEHIENSI